MRRPITPNEAALAAGFSSYHAYLTSDVWRRSPTRLAALRIAGGHCRICGDGRGSRPDFKLHVHHSRYDRVGREQHGDLIVFCDLCHDDVTEIRRRRSAEHGSKPALPGDRQGYQTSRPSAPAAVMRKH